MRRAGKTINTKAASPVATLPVHQRVEDTLALVLVLGEAAMVDSTKVALAAVTPSIGTDEGKIEHVEPAGTPLPHASVTIE